MLNVYAVCTFNWLFISLFIPVHPQCCAQSSGQVTICARGWRISPYSHGNTRPRPSRYLAADLVG